LLIRGSQPMDFTPPRPQPCRDWHSYRVTHTHNEAVGLSADEVIHSNPITIIHAQHSSIAE
jgi:hypothetical protein